MAKNIVKHSNRTVTLTFPQGAFLVCYFKHFLEVKCEQKYFAISDRLTPKIT